jgi:hypothetical protein
LNRANHTGTQTASTISDFNSASRAQTEAALIAGTNITITPAGSGATRTLTIAASGGGGYSANRNKVINGQFTVNQRMVSGTVVLAAGAYGHDRWKAGASGCTYTFAVSEGVTTITISAGSLIQVIEGANLRTGMHVLSWAGTAQGRIEAGSYSASGVTGSVTGGANLSIEFNTGTLTSVQLEPGIVPTPFELRFNELQLCQRYTILKDVIWNWDDAYPTGVGIFYTDHFPQMFNTPTATIVANASTGFGAIGSSTLRPTCAIWSTVVSAAGPAARTLRLAVLYEAEIP